MAYNIDKETDLTFDFDFETTISEVIDASLDYIKCPFESEVNVLITDNSGIKEINSEMRKIDSATDVLSFPFVDYKTAGDFSFLEEDSSEVMYYFEPEEGLLILGDIVISADKVKEQAENYNHSEKRELAFLVAHSMMHLFGFDHMTEDEERVMFKGQEEILSSLGINR